MAEKNNFLQLPFSCFSYYQYPPCLYVSNYPFAAGVVDKPHPQNTLCTSTLSHDSSQPEGRNTKCSYQVLAAFMQEKEQQITAIFWFWLQARRRVQDTALQMRPPHPISTRPPKAATGISHSLLYKHLCRELYTSYVTCMPHRRTSSLMNFIFFPHTAQIIGHCTKSVRESLPSPSPPLHTVAAAGNGCREDVNESPS